MIYLRREEPARRSPSILLQPVRLVAHSRAASALKKPPVYGPDAKIKKNDRKRDPCEVSGLLCRAKPQARSQFFVDPGERSYASFHQRRNESAQGDFPWIG